MATAKRRARAVPAAKVQRKTVEKNPATQQQRQLTMLELSPLLILLVVIAGALVYWRAPHSKTSDTPDIVPVPVAKTAPPAAKSDEDIKRLSRTVYRLEQRIKALEQPKQAASWWTR